MTQQAEERTVVALAKHHSGEPPRHVAIIMDGNGRWAQARGLPRSEGHRRGVEAVRRTVNAATDLGVDYLTLFSFSSENWSRPVAEVEFLFGLLRMFIRRDLDRLHRQGVRIQVIGVRDGLPGDIAALIDESEAKTAGNTGLRLIFAFNYGARQEITRAMQAIAKKVERGEISPEDIDETLLSAHLFTAEVPDPDLVIRTSGGVRLSTFLRWQAAYAEYSFVDVYWPAFRYVDFLRALRDFTRRERRYGR